MQIILEIIFLKVSCLPDPDRKRGSEDDVATDNYQPIYYELCALSK